MTMEAPKRPATIKIAQSTTDNPGTVLKYAIQARPKAQPSIVAFEALVFEALVLTSSIDSAIKPQLDRATVWRFGQCRRS